MFHKRNRQPIGLGILFNQHGLALAQSPVVSHTQPIHSSWHWQTFSSHALSACTSEWPEPHCLRWARQRSGFVAQTVGMALPQDKLMRFTFPLSPGMGTRQLQAHLQAQLVPALPWPISEVLWDYQLNASHDTAMIDPAPANRPAWLNAALQAQPSLQAEVLAVPKAPGRKLASTGAAKQDCGWGGWNPSGRPACDGNALCKTAQSRYCKNRRQKPQAS